MGGGARELFVLVDGWIEWHQGGLGRLEAPAAFVASIDSLAASCSIRFAEVSAIRLPRQDGQNPRPLHENAASFCSEQVGHARSAKPRQSIVAVGGSAQ